MSLILFLAANAWAQGSALWLRGPADPAATVDLVDHPIEDVVPDQGWSAEDGRALAALSEELQAVRPLVEVFDGELQIMGRLERAIADVHVIRGTDDRTILVAALRFQGFAVQRYFQDGLATDPAAESYRVKVGDTWEVGPWVDAVALDPDQSATPEDIPGEPEQAAFEATRARVRGMPRATLDFGVLPAGARAWVDGGPVDRAPDGSARGMVLPGMHRAAVFEGDAIAVRGRVRLAPGEVHTLWRRPTRGEIEALAASLDGVTSPVRLEPTVVDTLSLLEAPVHLVLPSEHGLIDYAVEGTFAVYVAPPAPVPVASPEPEPEEQRPGPRLATTTALAWVFDPAYALADGAPKSAAHAFAVQVGASFAAPLGPIEASIGIDVAVPTSSWASLDGAAHPVRARVQPWLGIGPTKVPLTVTIGGLFPSHLAIGLRARWPAQGPFALSAGWNEGIPLSGDQVAHVAWIGATGSLGLRPNGRSGGP